MAIAKTLKGNRLTIYCDYCFRNTTTETYFRCEDCRFDACPECFFTSIETEEHKSTHNFRIVSNLSKPLFCDGWTLLEELLLLDGTISYGFENFNDISKIVDSKSCLEIRKHFYKLIDVEDDTENEIETQDIKKSNPNDSYILSYMPKRKEFDSEILNEYETIIENLHFQEDDSEHEREFFQNMLHNYKNVLKRRNIWRNFIFNRNLVDIKNIKARESTVLGDVANKYKWIAQFISKDDFNLFISGLAKEKELKSMLNAIPQLSAIDENILKDVSKLLTKKEEELCFQLKLNHGVYIKLKKMALELFILKKPLKHQLYDLFDESDMKKASILYKWFVDQRIVIGETI